MTELNLYLIVKKIETVTKFSNKKSKNDFYNLKK